MQEEIWTGAGRNILAKPISPLELSHCVRIWLIMILDRV